MSCRFGRGMSGGSSVRDMAGRIRLGGMLDHAGNGVGMLRPRHFDIFMCGMGRRAGFMPQCGGVEYIASRV